MARRDLRVENGMMQGERHFSVLGNSLCVIVTKRMLAHAGLHADSVLDVTIVHGEIRIRPRQDYSQLPLLINDHNRR